ncbi:UBX domain-containing protein 1-like isoform X2 [Vitis riparia]|uniref:UBX domain-containing protein 1-like isoform X2 n=1 Tax=Vitis riparia TaxID=96939 RepID=UPI00155B253B|nr:UBX domain-containing protein 1-like isoform X2 [Vitis riparia]
MAVPEVNKELLGELEAMGFPVARATRALHFSGNDSLAAAVSWIIDHENDPDIDQMPSITVDIGIESPKPFQISEEMKKKAQELRNRARRRQEEEEKKREREREKNRIRAGKELLEAKRIDEENERKRMLAYWESEKEEQKRAREKLLKKLMEDKAERRSKLGLPPENPASVKTSLPVVLEKNSLFTKLDTKAEPLRECLRFLKKSHKERVGSLTGGIEFLELCGFERTEDGEFLFLPQEKVDMAVLNSAGSVLNSAMTNPFFGVFSS